MTSGSLASDGGHNHYATALVLDLTQKIIQSPRFELDTASSARYAERRIYEHLQSQGVTEFPYSSISIAEALAEVEADAVANYRIRLFSLDKGGIFQRLPLEAQQTLLQDITEVGEVPAFQTVVQQFPDIFMDPDFPPQGTDPAKWNPRVVVNRDGTVVKER